MADIEFNCPNCGKQLLIDDQGAGMMVPCPRCNQSIQIPVAPPTSNTPQNTKDKISTEEVRPEERAREEEKKKSQKGIFYTIIWGIGLIFLGLHSYDFEYLFDELALIRHAAIAPGVVTDNWQEIDTNEYGVPYVSGRGVSYKYWLPDGRSFSTTANYYETLPPNLPDSVQVEYLPDSPSISRIKGYGSSSIVGWIFGSLLIERYMSIMLLALGIWLMQKGVRDSKKLRATIFANFNNRQWWLMWLKVERWSRKTEPMR